LLQLELLANVFY